MALIFFEEKSDADYYIFKENENGKIRLPVEISIGDLICFLQSSLDKIKPVLILSASFDQASLNLESLKRLKSSHFELLETKMIFLNYSIRNSLLSLRENTNQVNSFSMMEEVFKEFFKKNEST